MAPRDPAAEVNILILVSDPHPGLVLTWFEYPWQPIYPVARFGCASAPCCAAESEFSWGWVDPTNMPT